MIFLPLFLLQFVLLFIIYIQPLNWAVTVIAIKAARNIIF